jgi:hypothetical protein
MILICSLIGISILFLINPTSTIATNTGSNGVGGGVWVHSGEMNTIDIDSVNEQNITNIYLHSNVLGKYSEDQVQDFIKNAMIRILKFICGLQFSDMMVSSISPMSLLLKKD